MATDRELFVLRAAWDYQALEHGPIDFAKLRARVDRGGEDMSDDELAEALRALAREELIDIEGEGPPDLTEHLFRVTWWGSDEADGIPGGRSFAPSLLGRVIIHIRKGHPPSPPRGS
jgi:hypothetical protein